MTVDEKIEKVIEAVEDLASAVAWRVANQATGDYESRVSLTDEKAALRMALRECVGWGHWC